ncbi:hypothetical protein [Proteiniborus sp.]|uniref:hypothetical protein n=1 Tax=Proteiniborus sp. TaxID=2079015 RepID=UPI0033236207
MKDYLKFLCSSLNIKLVYTNNKYTVLSNGTKDNIPVIRVHKMFKYCDESIAKAIIEYYVSRNAEFLHLIEEYLKQKGISKYKITKPVKFSYPTENDSLTENIGKSRTKSEIEASIFNITLTDFKGNVSQIKPNEAISPLNDDFYELDIIVDYTNT